MVQQLYEPTRKLKFPLIDGFGLYVQIPTTDPKPERYNFTISTGMRLIGTIKQTGDGVYCLMIYAGHAALPEAAVNEARRLLKEIVRDPGVILITEAHV